MSVFRTRHNTNFTTISNRLFDDERLAADEIGILAFLLSRPQDWEVRRPALMRRWKIGIVAMKRIVHSWMRTGWCQAAKVRMPNGQFYIEYRIYDLPGREMNDDEIREALSLVSSEVLKDGSPSISADEQPIPEGEPPLCQPGVVDHPLATEGWPNKDKPNNEIPRTESTQKPEREGARAREKHALNLAEFKRRWPTNASDDQARVDGAWWALSNEEGEAALVGISPFLDKLKRDHRKHPPAGFTYLSQKRWTLLDAKAEAAQGPQTFAPDSAEAKAVLVLHEIVGRTSAFFKIWRRPDGSVSYPKPITPRLAALAQAPDRESAWVELTHEQAGAWESLLRSVFDEGLARNRLREGSRAPWPWPPSVDGKIYTKADSVPPPTSEDLVALASEGQK